MPTDILYCPACNRKLRVPDEELGRQVQCPLCGITFMAPVRGGGPLAVQPPQPARVPEWRPPLTRRGAGGALIGPAIGLIVVSLLGMLINGSRIVIAIWFPDLLRQQQAFFAGLVQPPPHEVLVKGMLVEGAIFGPLNLLLLIAAVQMLRLRTYPLAIAGSVLALLNCSAFCCVFGWPFGIWALVVLLRPDVQEAFRQV